MRTKERRYENLTWDQLTPQEQRTFKIRYTILKLTEVATVVAVGAAIYFAFIN